MAWIVGRRRPARAAPCGLYRSRRAVVRDTDPVSTHEIEHLLHQYGGGAVFVAVALQALGAPLPGGTVLIAAALYAATAHGLPIAEVLVAGASGALAGTTLAYGLGRWGGPALLARIGRLARQSPERVERLRTEFAEHGAWLLFVARFITGLRNIAGWVAGTSGMRLRRFLPITAASAVVWALTNGLEYYVFGHALAGAGTWVQVVLVVAGIAWLVISVMVVRRRALRRMRGVS